MLLMAVNAIFSVMSPLSFSSFPIELLSCVISSPSLTEIAVITIAFISKETSKLADTLWMTRPIRGTSKSRRRSEHSNSVRPWYYMIINMTVSPLSLSGSSKLESFMVRMV